MGRFDFKTRTGQTSAIIQTISGFDLDAQSFFARVNAAGGTLTNTQQEAINTLVIQMKANDIWNSMKAIYPMVGASAAACAQNLKSSSFTATFSSGWTFEITGVTPNGTSAFMNTGFNPNSNLTISSAGLSVYTTTTSVAANQSPIDLGADLPTTGFNLTQKMTSPGNTLYHGRAFAQTINNVDANNIAGLHLISRNSTTSLKYFRNNSLIQTNTNLEVGGIPSLNTYLGALNNNGSASNFSNRQYAFATLSDGLTDTQASDFYTAVQAFQTTLARQV